MNASEIILIVRIGIKVFAVALALFGVFKIWRIQCNFADKYSKSYISLALNFVKPMPSSFAAADVPFFKQQRLVVTVLIVLAVLLLIFGDLVGQVFLKLGGLA